MRIPTILTCLLLAAAPLPCTARLFFIGSNPHTSRIAFPQDVLLVSYSYAAYRIAYQWGPSYGNPEDPFGKPDTSYTAHKEEITFAQQEGDTQTSAFSKKGATDLFTHTLIHQHVWQDRLHTLFSLSFKNLTSGTSFHGNLRGETEAGAVEYVDVSSSVQAQSHMVYLEATTGLDLFSVPVGIKLGYGREWKEKPKGSTEADVNGSTVESGRMLWGWSTSGCNHIFGYPHINGDAWFYDRYTTGHTDQFDLQLGATLDRVKIGSRYRFRTGVLEQYSWRSENVYDQDDLPQEETLDRNFNGSYRRADDAKLTARHIVRVYGNVTFMERSMFKLNTLFFVGGEFCDSENVAAGDHEAATGVKETERALILEVNPNVNIYPGRHTTIDAAILTELAVSRYENTYERGTSGGRKETYRNSAPHIGDEPWWENFSYADEHFFDIGAEINAYLPLYGNSGSSLGCSAILLYNNKFTYTTRYFGQTPEGSSAFDETHTRETYMRESWLNTSVGFTYRHDRFLFQLHYAQPLVYTRYLETRVKDGGGRTLYRKASLFEPGIQQGASASAHPEEFGTQMVSFMAAYTL